MENTSTLHAHVQRMASDCDGKHGHDYVAGPTDEEREDNFFDIRFRERVIAGIMSVTGMGGTLTTTCEPGEWATAAEWSAPTEEGSEWARVDFCEDESCDPNRSSQYDQFAEMAGY